MKLAEIEPAPQRFPPIAVKDNAFTLINNSIKVAVLENDSDLDGDQINILSFKQPANGNVSMNTGDMFISYFPDEDFTGIDTFEYTIIDDNQMKMIIEICNNCHIESVGAIDVQQLIVTCKKKLPLQC
jgi:hypothetical protein